MAGKTTAVIEADDGGFMVSVDGQVRGRFGALLDANWYALAMLNADIVASVRLLGDDLVT